MNNKRLVNILIKEAEDLLNNDVTNIQFNKTFSIPSKIVRKFKEFSDEVKHKYKRFFNREQDIENIEFSDEEIKEFLLQYLNDVLNDGHITDLLLTAIKNETRGAKRRLENLLLRKYLNK